MDLGAALNEVAVYFSHKTLLFMGSTANEDKNSRDSRRLNHEQDLVKILPHIE